MKTHLVLISLASLVFGSVAHAGSIISSVTPVSSSQAATIEAWVDGVNIYKDRSPGHRLVNVPPELSASPGLAPQVIQNSNSDKTKGDYQLQITTDRLGIVYIGLDERHRDKQPLAWMQDPAQTGLPGVFFDTHRTVDIDEGSTAENAGESIENSFNMWAAIAPAGTYNFFAQDFGGGSNMYFVGADDHLLTVPEPAGLTMIGLALLGLARIRRRR